ncbi:MAG: YggS family pyridoxal phosphate-dependent enzyme [Phycisphaerales bacterium]|nr:YggS family pyridoxal phosphate-dependent enzyme [Phycisphaerales bacterium]
MDSTAHLSSDGSATGECLRQRLEEVRGRIATAAIKSGRRADQVLLVVVSKTASLEQMRELSGMGQTDFGENRIQQLTQRAAQMDEFLARRRQMQGIEGEIRWHMIGSLQRNKVSKAVELSRLIHSVDSLRLAEEIESCAGKREKPVDVLIEVNISSEESKHGISAPAVRHVVDQIDTMANVRPRGLMCMAPIDADDSTRRSLFTRCREILEDVRKAGAGGARFDLLSMGMSGDFETAIECGANIVRIGSAVLGSPAVSETPEGQ